MDSIIGMGRPTGELPTISSSAWTACNPPSSIRRRQLNSKLGTTPARSCHIPTDIPGCIRKTMEVEILKETLDVARVKRTELPLPSWNGRKGVRNEGCG